MVRRFLIKLALFSVPIILVVGLPIGFALYIGEALPIPFVLRLRSQYPQMVYGPRFGRDIFALSQLTITQRQPQILAIGSSRAWMLRSEMFVGENTVFYNASDAGWTLAQIDSLIHELPAEAYPQILLIGIDKPWFNADFVPVSTISNENQSVSRLESTTLATMAHALTHLADLPALFNRRNPVTGELALGIDGITTGVGIRSDGSLQHGQVIQGIAPINEMINQHHRLLDNHAGIFVSGNQASIAALSRLDRLLDFAQAQDIKVIGFSPPFAPSIYERLAGTGQHDYIWQVDPALYAVFKRHDFDYFDFTDPAATGAHETDFWDGWHSSELISTRMLILMARDSISLAKVVDIDQLEAAVTTAAHTFYVFDN